MTQTLNALHNRSSGSDLTPFVGPVILLKLPLMTRPAELVRKWLENPSTWAGPRSAIQAHSYIVEASSTHLPDESRG